MQKIISFFLALSFCLGHSTYANKLQKSADLISIYSSQGIEFAFKHVKKDYIANKPSYYDIWHLWEAYESNNGKRGQKLIQRGEWETAIKLNTGFVGGQLHGFERKKSINFIVDGKTIDEDANIPLTSFKKLTIIQRSSLYAYNDTTERIAEVLKRWEIDTNCEIKLKQQITWLKEQHIEAAYLSMFPVMRENNGIFITTKAERDDIKMAENVASAGSLKYIGSENKTNKANRLTVWGDSYCFSLAVKRHKRMLNSSLWLWAANQYNKIYFDYCGNYETAVGEIFKVSSTFKFTVTNTK